MHLFTLHRRRCWCSPGLLSSKDLRSVFSPDPQEPHLSQPKPHSGEMPPTFQRAEPQEGPGKGSDPRPHTWKAFLPQPSLEFVPLRMATQIRNKIFGTVSRHRIKGNFVLCLGELSWAGGLETWIPFLGLSCVGDLGYADSVSPPVPHELSGSGQCYYSET